MIFPINLRFIYVALLMAVLAVLMACTGTDRSSDPARPFVGRPDQTSGPCRCRP